MERISGPIADRFFIAGYVVRAHEGAGYVGYAKVCEGRPGSVWDCTPKCKVSGQPDATREGALGSAEHAATEVIKTFLRMRCDDASPQLETGLLRLAAQTREMQLLAARR